MSFLFFFWGGENTKNYEPAIGFTGGGGQGTGKQGSDPQATVNKINFTHVRTYESSSKMTLSVNIIAEVKIPLK